MPKSHQQSSSSSSSSEPQGMCLVDGTGQDLYGNAYLNDQLEGVVFAQDGGVCAEEGPSETPWWSEDEASDEWGQCTLEDGPEDLQEHWRREAERTAALDKPLEAPLIDPISMIAGGITGGLLSGTLRAAVSGFFQGIIPVEDILAEPFKPGPEPE